MIAVHVLTHESMHMAGLTAEAEAECAAVQRDAQTARLLGANAQQAEFLSRAYWHGVYPDMPDDYRTGRVPRRVGRWTSSSADGPWSFS